jgi:hypothetical protein
MKSFIFPLSSILFSYATDVRAYNPNAFLAVELRSAVIPASAKSARNLIRGIPRVDLLDLTNSYLVDFAIGSPPQPINLIVDTGSSWLWVNPSCQWASNQRLCLQLPVYSPSKSTPAPKRVPALDGFQDYASGWWAQIEGYSDAITLDSDNTLANQAFGVAVESDGAFSGFIGLGPDMKTGFNSAAANYSILNTMLSQGLINSRTFSLGLETTLTFAAESPSNQPLHPLEFHSLTL